MFTVRAAPAAGQDVERIYHQLSDRVAEGLVGEDFPDRFFDEVEEAIEGLSDFAERHPPAPERWRREVRHVLLACGYRVLYEVRGKSVWVLRIRHQRQRRLKGPGAGTSFNPELLP